MAAMDLSKMGNAKVVLNTSDCNHIVIEKWPVSDVEWAFYLYAATELNQAGIAGPFSQVRFCPTGGISPANYRDYLALKSVLCIGGSWLVPADALEAGDWDRITKLAREAVEGAKQ